MKDKEHKFDTSGILPFDIPLAVAPETEEDGLHKNTLLQLPLGPAYALTGHKAKGLTMFMTYVSFLKFWGQGTGILEVGTLNDMVFNKRFYRTKFQAPL